MRTPAPPGRAARPAPPRPTRPGVVRLAAACLSLLLAPVATLPAQAAAPDTLGLAQAIVQARAANPMLQAARARADAARERQGPAGAWPEPELGLGLMNRSLGGEGMAEPMGMTTLRVTQMIPWQGTRAASGRAARARADAEALALRDEEAGVVAAVTAAYARLATIQAEQAIRTETRDLLLGLRQVAMARHSAGEAPQLDVLQVQVAVARMDGDLVMLEGERQAAAARLAGLLGRGSGHSITVAPLPELLPALPSLDSLVTVALAGRPALGAGAARVQAAGHDREAIRRERWPDLMVSAEYARRADFEDMASLMVGARLPILAGSRQRPMEREAEAMERMAAADLTALEVETRAMLAEARAEAERARRLHDLYETAILPQAEAAVRAARSAYQVGTADFAGVLDAQMILNDYRVERWRLIADYHTARATIAALQGSVEAGR